MFEHMQAMQAMLHQVQGQLQQSIATIKFMQAEETSIPASAAGSSSAPPSVEDVKASSLCKVALTFAGEPTVTAATILWFAQSDTAPMHLVQKVEEYRAFMPWCRDFDAAVKQYSEIKGLVDRNAKKRFGLCIPEGEEELHIRAHQGHTICNVEDASLLREVTDATELPVLCHGTFSHLWPKIQTEGLRAMKRNHIHCVAVDLADPVNQGRVLSGTRGESDVIVYIDAEKAMAEGVVFHWSDNDVVLTRGYTDDNKLPPHLFSGHARWSWEEQQWKAEYSNN
ncbi:unnamed protein product [Polarella glacialis]|uniref:2'-phosphotransferase n=1 Tax=Polarella glacialis TaxID=89957 RepID=A0A813GBU1_POLGL|nr:unnamed protein product [Polarella glacialis]